MLGPLEMFCDSMSKDKLSFATRHCARISFALMSGHSMVINQNCVVIASLADLTLVLSRIFVLIIHVYSQFEFCPEPSATNIAWKIQIDIQMLASNVFLE